MSIGMDNLNLVKIGFSMVPDENQASMSEYLKNGRSDIVTDHNDTRFE